MPNLSQYILANNTMYDVLQQALRRLLEPTNEFTSPMMQNMRHQVYASWYQRNTTQPDYVFEAQWRQLGTVDFAKHKSWSIAIFQPLTTHYFDKGDKVTIQSSKFDDWQTLISNNSSLPILATKVAQFTHGESINDTFYLLDTLKEKLGYCPYLTPDEPLLENYIRTAGLYETHMHLNGTSSFEQCWYQALVQPELFIDSLQEGQEENNKVKLLYVINPHLRDLKDYSHLLLLARYLRESILTWLESGDRNTIDAIKTAQENVLDIIKGNGDSLSGYLGAERRQFGNIEGREDDSFTYDVDDQAHVDTHIREVHWQVRVQYKLLNQSKDNTSEFFDMAYLLYIVCMNNLHRLFVQGSEQYGFDNFQKFADDNARKLAEKTYKNRFFQLHGPYRDAHSDMAAIEGRFTPKGSLAKNKKILQDVLLGFVQYNDEIRLKNSPQLKNPRIDSRDLRSLINETSEQPVKLYLIAHFIKIPEKSDNDYRFAKLRLDLREKAVILMDLLEFEPKLRQVIQGIDAAANELDAPPAVFAPIYHYCRQRGMKHFTYHVGEDFESLVSGIRAIYEAIEFLKLENGDRLGHATAIGIHPTQWLKSTPDTTYLKRDEWLDNLIFIQKMILSYNLQGFNLLVIETEINRLYHDIYHDLTDYHQLNLHVLRSAYEYQYIEPETVQDYLENKVNVLSHEDMTELNSLDKKALALLKETWFNDTIRKRRDKRIPIESTFLAAKQLISLQQCVQNIVCDKKIVIESLLTSNVRISHYQSLYNHHIFRWLSVKERKVKGDAKMKIILGSDDPGIFATDLRGEYYHLYSVLKHKFDYSDSKSLKVIEQLNNNSRVYHFH